MPRRESKTTAAAAQGKSKLPCLLLRREREAERESRGLVEIQQWWVCTDNCTSSGVLLSFKRVYLILLYLIQVGHHVGVKQQDKVSRHTKAYIQACPHLGLLVIVS